MPQTSRTPPSSNDRNCGLDTLRAAAIALVFMYHYMVFVSRQPTFGWASVVGWMGVDLFFVLSGYLIGNQLFAGLARGQRISLGAFYARRAFRTLPVFWVVLALYFLFPSIMGGNAPPPLWRFLTFTQNIGLPPGTAFSHAWSLCIEEQFYLVLPLVLVAGARCAARRWHGWALMALSLCLGVGARSWLWRSYGLQSGNVAGYMPWVYYATLCRFDEFLPGLAVAMLRNFHRPLWERISAHGNALLVTGTAATAAMFVLAFHRYYIDGYGYGFFMTAFGYSLGAMAFALLVAAALSPTSWLRRLRIPGAFHLALWSYAIYLSHKPIAFIVHQQFKSLNVDPGLELAVVIAASLAGGWLLHRLVEAPFMAWRDRHVSSSFVTAAIRAWPVSGTSPG
ncbi:acyltransferase [Piscinibacter sp. XHJ-5]|uniref:acyltransferase family protein n=1 Tax=Piscinibacter sp. XHJ-5 TaxID=3037797 RepID=UPI002452C1C5|nr:acyltransferase [Piscinibacter sp. XHJ-5]